MVTEGEISAEISKTVSFESFFRSLKNLLPLEVIKAHIRVTPQGVFVEESIKDIFFKTYQNWLITVTQGNTGSNERKCFRRLFNTENPSLYYLLEGKKSLLGYLVNCQISNPQDFRLPHYLGSLTLANDTLYQNDIRLQQLSNVKVQQTSSGIEIQIKIKRWIYKVSQKVLFAFRSVIENSHLIKRYPNVSDSLLDTIKALGSVLYDAKPINRYIPLIIPQEISSQKNLILIYEDVIFNINEEKFLTHCYAIKGKNLFNFIKSELENAAIKKIINVGALELKNHSRDYCATLNIMGKKYFVTINAVRNLIEFCSLHKIPHLKTALHYTVFDVLRALSSIAEHSEVVEKRFIPQSVVKLSPMSNNFRQYERWILIANGNKFITHCAEKGRIDG